MTWLIFCQGKVRQQYSLYSSEICWETIELHMKLRYNLHKAYIFFLQRIYSLINYLFADNRTEDAKLAANNAEARRRFC